MKYLILMFFKYYREGKQTKNIAYFYSITAVILCLHIVFFSLMSLLKINFTIIGMGENKLLNYLVMGSIMSIEFIIIYHFYPPKKVKRWYKNFKNNKRLNLFIILTLMIFFVFIFIKW